MDQIDVLLILVQVIAYPIVGAIVLYVIYFFYDLAFTAGAKNRKTLIRGSVLDPDNHPSKD